MEQKLHSTPPTVVEKYNAIIESLKNRDYKSILCIGEKASSLKNELMDYQFLCIDIKEISHAADLLKRALQAEGILPNAIIADINLDPKLLNNFLNLLKSSVKMRSIPLLFFTENVNEVNFEKYFYKNSLVDDIYCKTSNVKNIADRINFLLSFKKQLNEINGAAGVTVINNNFKFDVNYSLKRLVDIVVSGVLLLVLMPVFLLTAIAISLESRGPVLYSSKRAGKGFKVFKFYKFRSMYTGADAEVKSLQHLNQYSQKEGSGPKFFKISNDPRVTKIGSFLRNTSLDELPQLYNVLIGDMSIVGNRPLPLYEAQTITTDNWSRRFLAPAGLTGLWQVTKRGKKEMSVSERIDLDISYANKWSFLSDISIILKTPKALLQKDKV